MYDQTLLMDRELIILSSIFKDEECKEWFANNEVNPNLFRNPQSQVLMKGFNAVSEDGTVPTKILLLDQVCGADEKHREKFGEFIDALSQSEISEPLEAIKKHLAFLRSSYKISDLQDGLKSLIEKMNLHNPVEADSELDRFKNDLENMIYEINEDTDEVKQMTLAEGLRLVQKSMKESLTSDTSENVSSGYKDLDVALDGGMKKGTFCMIAARPGMGKTVWMLNSAYESSKLGNKVLFISIEMSLLQCFQRLVSKIADISGSKIQQPEKMLDDDWVRLQESCLEIVSKSEQNLFVQEITEITVPQLERIIKYYKKKYDIDAVYVDYAQIMLTKDGQEPSDSSDFAQISGGLRRAAKNQNVAIVVGSQLNRNVESRTDKKPIMADIRNSGAFEQDAARIIALYRDEVYNGEDSLKPNILELIFLKNRFGKNNITLEYNYDLEKQNILQKKAS